ncbi:hypothetical protein CTA2_7741 [Colletotrichum tanaceti]|uniref:Uncharacterized protein n=1 Tax=Colletotrichum tanaceti TaxID=1306861 RepID=A0A4U6XNQ2_9PEZI|nr:hypothetical protein CTA2_7741 [Colletotrichum tanaceti]TKW57390.1 hypothetical protein CTA1_353 [Colletotrichum tanaceti]
MTRARLQHVTRILRQLPLRSICLPSPARHSSSKRKVVEQTAAPISESPQVPDLDQPRSIPDLEKAQLSQQWRQIFDVLDIGIPANDLKTIRLPPAISIAHLVVFRASKRHVMRVYDTALFMETNYQHPKSVLMRHYYEEDKKNKPLWLWFYGVSANSKPAVVRMAKYCMKLALHAALKDRGYDAQGRLIDPKSEMGMGTTLRGDLRGTITCVAKAPKDVVKRLPRQDLRAAADAAVDEFIRVLEKLQLEKEMEKQKGGKMGPKRLEEKKLKAEKKGCSLSGSRTL